MASKKWFDGLRKGDQASHLYSSAAERATVVTDLIAWMGEDEKLIFLGEGEDDLLSGPSRIIEAAMDEGRVEVLHGRTTFAASGKISAEGMDSAIELQLARSSDDGYDGLVVVWDLTWLARETADFETFLEHQSRLILRPLSPGLTTLGQYDLTTFRTDQVERILRVSPLVLEGGELRRNFWVVSNHSMGRPPRPDRLSKPAAGPSETTQRS